MPSRILIELAVVQEARMALGSERLAARFHVVKGQAEPYNSKRSPRFRITSSLNPDS